MKVLIPLFLTKSDTISYFPAYNNMVIYRVTGDAEFEPQSPQGILNEENWDSMTSMPHFWTEITDIL